jgi:hypothetical protein
MKILATRSFDYGVEYVHTYSLVQMSDGTHNVRYQATLMGVEVDSSVIHFDVTPPTAVSQFDKFAGKLQTEYEH